MLPDTALTQHPCSRKGLQNQITVESARNVDTGCEPARVWKPLSGPGPHTLAKSLTQLPVTRSAGDGVPSAGETGEKWPKHE